MKDDNDLLLEWKKKIVRCMLYNINAAKKKVCFGSLVRQKCLNFLLFSYSVVRQKWLLSQLDLIWYTGKTYSLLENYLSNRKLIILLCEINSEPLLFIDQLYGLFCFWFILIICLELIFRRDFTFTCLQIMLHLAKVCCITSTFISKISCLL